jgi:hypothetical protein
VFSVVLASRIQPENRGGNAQVNLLRQELDAAFTACSEQGKEMLIIDGQSSDVAMSFAGKPLSGKIITPPGVREHAWRQIYRKEPNTMVMFALLLVGFIASLLTIWDVTRKIRRARKQRRHLKH